MSRTAGRQRLVRPHGHLLSGSGSSSRMSPTEPGPLANQKKPSISPTTGMVANIGSSNDNIVLIIFMRPDIFLGPKAVHHVVHGRSATICWPSSHRLSESHKSPTRHASEQATIRQVFIVAVNIFTVLFGVISIALAKLLDRIMTLLENMGDSFVETYNVINRISGVVEKIVAGLNRLDDSKPQKSKKKSPPPTAALGTTQDPQRPLN